jgi:hypothetical protein
VQRGCADPLRSRSATTTGRRRGEPFESEHEPAASDALDTAGYRWQVVERDGDLVVPAPSDET